MREGFDASGRLTRLQDPNGNALTLTYEPNGLAQPPGAWGLTTRLKSITDPSGRAWSLAYGADGYVNRVTDPLGRAYTLAHDAAGNLTAITDPLGRTTTYEYDANHLLTRYTYPGGNATSLAYDAERRMTQHTDALAAVSTATYGNGSNRFTNERGAATTYSFNDYGAITQVADPVQTTMLTYDDARRLTITAPPYQRFRYDERGNLTERSSAVALRTTYDRPSTSPRSRRTPRAMSPATATTRAAT